jgi:cytochrome bd ubiquinol oxidase subunit II
MDQLPSAAKVCDVLLKIGTDFSYRQFYSRGGGIGVAGSIHQCQDGVPFVMVALIFATAFGTLAISFWPYMIPFANTIEDAAASHSSLGFMFWEAGFFVFPLMLLCTATDLLFFRGKVRSPVDHR